MREASMPGMPVQLFAERRFDDVASEVFAAVKNRIDGERDQDILSVNIEEYVEQVYADNAFRPLIVHFDKITVQRQWEHAIPPDAFPQEMIYAIDPKERHRRRVIVLRIPYEGTSGLLPLSAGHIGSLLAHRD